MNVKKQFKEEYNKIKLKIRNLATNKENNNELKIKAILKYLNIFKFIDNLIKVRKMEI